MATACSYRVVHADQTKLDCLGVKFVSSVMRSGNLSSFRDAAPTEIYTFKISRTGFFIFLKWTIQNQMNSQNVYVSMS